MLTGEHIRLVPLQMEHATTVQRWVDDGDPGLGMLHGSPLDFGGDAVAFVGSLVDAATLPGADLLPFAVQHGTTGEVLGFTRYLFVDPGHRSLHIGGTWYIPPARGTVVNPDAKLLLLQHAFVSGFNRVQIQTDVRNARSQRAITRIGATFEGVSRADMQRRDGTVRDTWVASVIRTEWPAVRRRLEQLVAGSAPVPSGHG